METVKTVHLTFVGLSFAGFFIRGIWLLGLVIFLYIVSVAPGKSALGWFAFA